MKDLERIEFYERGMDCKFISARGLRKLFWATTSAYVVKLPFHRHVFCFDKSRGRWFNFYIFFSHWNLFTNIGLFSFSAIFGSFSAFPSLFQSSFWPFSAKPFISFQLVVKYSAKFTCTVFVQMRFCDISTLCWH